jgi:putative ABC transport system permease protein
MVLETRLALTETLQMALVALRGNRLRSLLAMLGIAIGNGAVVALMAIGQGTKESTLAQFKALGPNVIFVSLSSARVRRTLSQSAKPLLLEDAEAIANQVSAVKAVAPEFSAEQLVNNGRENFNINIVGTSPDYLGVRNYRLAAGRFLNPVDLQRTNRVVILGAKVAERLFGQDNPVGQIIRIRNLGFVVVGVLEPKGTLFGTDYDDLAIIPISTLMRQVIGWNVPYGIPIKSVSLLAKDESYLSTAAFQVKNLLQLRHPEASPNDIQVEPQNSLLETTNAADEGLTQMLTAIASISLLVGGIGVMNVMLVSVTERTQEIGLRKALGAKQGDILGQFLLEAVILTSLGGGGGIVITVVGLEITTSLTWVVASISLPSIALALGVSCSIGLFFGVFPAQRAAQLDPIQALRGTG